jgi:threonine dehydrogenase-like Zn-dependent dehydrogenase
MAALFAHTFSMATDIVPKRLELAKKLGADVTIDCRTENLKDRGQRLYPPLSYLL